MIKNCKIFSFISILFHQIFFLEKGENGYSNKNNEESENEGLLNFYFIFILFL
jgi:hypothetical protein